MQAKSTRYKVLYSKPALNDIEGIIDYLIQYSSTAAEKFIDHLDHKINLLKPFPKIGATPRIENLKEKGYRIIVLKHKYLLFYTVAENEQVIMIERILHGARDLMEILI